MSQFVVEDQGVDFFVAGGQGEVFLHRRPAIINLKCRDEGALERTRTRPQDLPVVWQIRQWRKPPPPPPTWAQALGAG